MKSSCDSFEQAFQILDHALEQQTSPELSALVSNEAQLLKANLHETSVDLIRSADQSVRENPLEYLALVGAGALILGIYASARAANNSSRGRARTRR